MHKHTRSPRAKHPIHLRPQPSGEFYDYDVPKQWVVKDVISEDEIVGITRTGKEHALQTNDPNLRKASLWEIFWYGIQGRWPKF